MNYVSVITLCHSTLRLTFLEKEWFLVKSPLPTLLIRVQDIKVHCDISCAFNALIIPRHCLWQYQSPNFLVNLSEVCSCWGLLKHTCAWKTSGYAELLYCLSYLPLTVCVFRSLDNCDDKSTSDNHMNFQILQKPPRALTVRRVTTCHCSAAVCSGWQRRVFGLRPGQRGVRGSCKEGKAPSA